MSLKLLLDNGDPKVWENFLQTGIFTGITTNPTLLKQAGQPCNLFHIKELTKKAQDLGCKEMHLQAWGNDCDELTNCGIALGQMSTSQLNIHVKVPITKRGAQAAQRLIAANFSITLTACYKAKQIFIATALGANYIAPYLGRINDLGGNGLAEIIKMQRSLNGLSSECKILVASIRKCKELNILASEGIEIFTINTNLATDLFEVKETIEAQKIFEKDAKSSLI